MSEEKEPVAGEPGEHPLSVLLFSWMRTPLFKTMLAWSLLVTGAALIGLETWLAFRPIKDVTYAPGFQGMFGFLAFVFAVLSGWPLGKMLRRSEGYYDSRRGEADRDD
jgi:hypothetical protein